MDKQLTERQWQILQNKIEYEDMFHEQWKRDVYMGAYSSDIQALATAGYLDRRLWEIPNNPGMTFGYEYHVNSLGRRECADYQQARSARPANIQHSITR